MLSVRLVGFLGLGLKKKKRPAFLYKQITITIELITNSSLHIIWIQKTVKI